MKRLLFIASICLCLFHPGQVRAEAPIPPAPTGGDYIVDQADILSDEQEANLNSTLASYEKQTSVEIGILTVSSIENDYIENFSLNVARNWGIGQEGKNNGALLIVSVNDRKLRIEVGTGLEGDLTDSRAGQIIRNRITPQFKQGNYYQGIREGVDGMILAINATDDPQLQASSISAANADDWLGLFVFAGYLLVTIVSWFASMLGRSKRWWPGGIIGGILGLGIGALISGTIATLLVSAFVTGFFGLLFDYLVSKNYRQSIRRGEAPSWWAGGWGGSSPGGGGGSWGGFGGGGGFSGGGSSGSW